MQSECCCCTHLLSGRVEKLEFDTWTFSNVNSDKQNWSMWIIVSTSTWEWKRQHSFVPTENVCIAILWSHTSSFTQMDYELIWPVRAEKKITLNVAPVRKLLLRGCEKGITLYNTIHLYNRHILYLKIWIWTYWYTKQYTIHITCYLDINIAIRRKVWTR